MPPSNFGRRPQDGPRVPRSAIDRRQRRALAATNNPPQPADPVAADGRPWPRDEGGNQ